MISFFQSLLRALAKVLLFLGLVVLAHLLFALVKFSIEPNQRLFESLTEAQDELAAHVPDGTALSDLETYLELAAWECSDVLCGVIYCHAPGPPMGLWGGRKWLLSFEIMDEKLKSTTVKEGFVGL